MLAKCACRSAHHTLIYPYSLASYVLEDVALFFGYLDGMRLDLRGLLGVDTHVFLDNFVGVVAVHDAGLGGGAGEVGEHFLVGDGLVVEERVDGGLAVRVEFPLVDVLLSEEGVLLLAQFGLGIDHVILSGFGPTEEL